MSRLRGTYSSVELYRLRKMLKALASKEGRGTELVSVYVPAGRPLSDVVNNLRQEYATAANIKSDRTRKNVQSALERVIQRLRMFKQTPPNGLVVFCGSIPQNGPGSEKMETYVIIPPEPIDISYYGCGSKFYVEPLLNMFREKEVYGILLIDSSRATYAALTGSRLEVLKDITSGVPGKHRAGGQCLSAETLVQVSDGRIVRLEELKEGERIMCFDFENYKLVSAECRRIFRRRGDVVKFAYEIFTKSPSVSIKATPEHRFFILDETGVYEKTAEEIEKGDVLLLATGCNILRSEGELDIPSRLILTKSGREYLRRKRLELGITQKDVANTVGVTQATISKLELGHWNPRSEKLRRIFSLYNISEDYLLDKGYAEKLRRLEIPGELKGEFYQLLGYLLGGGSRERNRIVIFGDDEELVKFYSQMAKRLFKVNPVVRWRKSCHCYKISINVAEPVKLIEREFHGILIPERGKRTIPYRIQMLPEDKLCLFLRGLFDAEGWVSIGSMSIGIGMKSKEIIRVLQLLLLRLGIASSIFSKKNVGGKIHLLEISDENSIRIFQEKIGFSSSRKTGAVREILKKEPDVSQNRLPHINGRYAMSLMKPLPISGINFLKISDLFNNMQEMSFTQKKSNISIWKNSMLEQDDGVSIFYGKALNKLQGIQVNALNGGDKLTCLLEKLLCSGIVGLRVEGKKRIKVKASDMFYDLWIPKFGNFIANGLIVHNSARRFERLREMELNEFFRRAGKHFDKLFLNMDNLKGLIIGGPGPTKRDFVEGGYINYMLKKKIIAVVDTAYVGEAGLRDLLGRVSDILKDVRRVKEVKLIQSFLEHISKDTGLATYGERDVRRCLEKGIVDTLILSEDLQAKRLLIECSNCDYSQWVTVQLADVFSFKNMLATRKCPKCNLQMLRVNKQRDLIDDFIEMAEDLGVKVEIVSSRTEEGEMLLKSFGGIAAVLKYRAWVGGA